MIEPQFLYIHTHLEIYKSTYVYTHLILQFIVWPRGALYLHFSVRSCDCTIWTKGGAADLRRFSAGGNKEDDVDETRSFFNNLRPKNRAKLVLHHPR